MPIKLLPMFVLVAALTLPDHPAFAQRGGRGGGGPGGGGMQRGGGSEMQRGGRGGGGRQQQPGGFGGGMQRGGGSEMQRGGGGPGTSQAGGFGGGLSSRSPQGGLQGGGVSSRSPQGGLQSGSPPSMGMGPFGRGSSSGPGMNPGAGGSSRPGVGSGTAPGTGADIGTGARPGVGGGPNQPGTIPGRTDRPGLGAGEAGRLGAGAGAGAGPGQPNRPGIGPGTAREPGVEPAVRPGAVDAADATRPGLSSRGDQDGAGLLPRTGAGAGRPGIGAGGVGGPDSGIGVLPGAGAGRAGVAGADRVDRRTGSYYVGDSARVAQRDTVVAGWYAYPAYNPALYAGAWQASNMTGPSIYVNPGYGSLAAMLGIASQASPYDYGSNVVTQAGGVYVDGDLVGSPQQYAEEAGQLALAGSAEPDPNAAWQPIGVFAMLDDSQTDPVDLFQFAINPQGLIRGNYHNMTSGETVPLAGSVDRATQRAAWTIDGDQLPVYEAGLANLTADQTTMLVHAPDGQQHQFNLIRLPDPTPPPATP